MYGRKKNPTHTHFVMFVFLSFPPLFFFVRTVKRNCSVSAHILIRNGKMSHSKQTATDPGSQQTSLSLQSISGSSTGLSKQHCSAGGEAEKDFYVFCWVSSDIQPSSLSGMLHSLRPSHLDLGGLFFCSAVLTSLFNSADSRLHFGRRERERGSAPECLPMLRCLRCLVLGALKDA